MTAKVTMDLGDPKNVPDQFIAGNYDIGSLRPWIGGDGKSYWSDAHGNNRLWEPVNKYNKPTGEPARLTREQWGQLDKTTVENFRLYAPITFFLWGQELTFVLPNGLRNIVLEEPDPRVYPHLNVDRNCLSLPITHEDFSISQYDITKARSAGVLLSDDCLLGVQLAAQRVGQTVDGLLLGTVEIPTYGGAKIRSLKEATVMSGKRTLCEMEMKLQDNKFYGPYFWIGSSGCDAEVQIIPENGAHRSVVLCGQIDRHDLYLIQKTPDVIRIVIGQYVTPVQWGDSYKVMCVIVPQLRGDPIGAVVRK